jgi:uncharacterized DUF497 family protein
MPYSFDFSPEKNQQLKLERQISFEEIIFIIANDGILDIYEHPNKEKYPKQKIIVISIDDYAYLVPAIFEEDKIFLKTIIPSRKATRDYLKEKQ